MPIAAKMTDKGQVTVPHTIRNELGFHNGDTLLFEVKDNMLIVRKPKNLMDYFGFLGKAGLPDDEEELLTPDVARKIQERV